MNPRQHPIPSTYFAIFGWLLGLTALEVGVVMADWPRAAIVTLLVATAMAKALLIALFFMHLKFDRWTVWLLPGVPVLLALLFVGMLFPDLVFHLVNRI